MTRKIYTIQAMDAAGAMLMDIQVGTRKAETLAMREGFQMCAPSWRPAPSGTGKPTRALAVSCGSPTRTTAVTCSFDSPEGRRRGGASLDCQPTEKGKPMDTERYCLTLDALDRVQAIRAIQQAYLQLSATRDAARAEGYDNDPALHHLHLCLKAAGHIGHNPTAGCVA